MGHKVALASLWKEAQGTWAGNHCRQEQGIGIGPVARLAWREPELCHYLGDKHRGGKQAMVVLCVYSLPRLLQAVYMWGYSVSCCGRGNSSCSLGSPSGCSCNPQRRAGVLACDLFPTLALKTFPVSRSLLFPPIRRKPAIAQQRCAMLIWGAVALKGSHSNCVAQWGLQHKAQVLSWRVCT